MIKFKVVEGTKHLVDSFDFELFEVPVSATEWKHIGKYSYRIHEWKDKGLCLYEHTDLNGCSNQFTIYPLSLPVGKNKLREKNMIPMYFSEQSICA